MNDQQILPDVTATFAALESVTRRQYAILWRLAESAPDAMLAAMDDADRAAMPELAGQAWNVAALTAADVLRRA